MKKIKYALADAGYATLAAMPFWLLYIMAFTLWVPFYYLVRYRRKVVRENIDAAFPVRTRKWQRYTGKVFYLYFIEFIFETIKLRNISSKRLAKHITFENVDLIRRYAAEGQPIIGYFSHCINWEWVIRLGELFTDMPQVQPCEVYTPLKNKWVDQTMVRQRSRFNCRCFPRQMAYRDLLGLIDQGRVPFCVFMSDQRPNNADKWHVVNFLGHRTAMLTGTETVARKLGAAAVFLDMSKISRGHYHVRVVPMADNVTDTPQYAMTELYARLLEKNIHRQPPIWLWSHKRWKDPVPDGVTDSPSHTSVDNSAEAGAHTADHVTDTADHVTDTAAHNS